MTLNDLSFNTNAVERMLIRSSGAVAIKNYLQVGDSTDTTRMLSILDNTMIPDENIGKVESNYSDQLFSDVEKSRKIKNYADIIKNCNTPRVQSKLISMMEKLKIFNQNKQDIKNLDEIGNNFFKSVYMKIKIIFFLNS